MEHIYIVMLLALIEYQVFGMLVARARGKYQVKAPAVSGPPEFERVHRVHQNTLEALVVFVPAIWLFGEYVSTLWGSVVGLVFVIGRILYARGYIAAAEKRGPGAGISGIALTVLVLGALIGVLMSVFRSG